MRESSRIEYKRQLNDNFEKEVVAFLNSREGGVIYIGIEDSGELYGVLDVDDVQLKIKDRLKNNIQPSVMGLFDVIHEVRDDKDIVRINIAGGPEKPYYLKKYGMTGKGCFMRVGSASEPMPQRMIDEFYSGRTRSSIGKIRSPRQDLTFEQLKIYYPFS
ncbi:AlbA family DNA-binding domain-containing protein [Methanoplanus limicola]|uniref:AlbA family DNA-binding domain-containing protein n=1 Tax=Methanoplanus limicola TaxID=2315 RepID=UPI000A02935C|nr:ATP-binding protein [Methanoplanus limicola]